MPCPLRLPPPHESHLSCPLRDTGIHGRKLFEGIKDLLLFALLGFIDRLGLLGKLDHPPIGEGSPEDIPTQVFHGRLIFRPNAVAVEDLESRMTPVGEHGDHPSGVMAIYFQSLVRMNLATSVASLMFQVLLPAFKATLPSEEKAQLPTK